MLFKHELFYKNYGNMDVSGIRPPLVSVWKNDISFTKLMSRIGK